MQESREAGQLAVQAKFVAAALTLARVLLPGAGVYAPGFANTFAQLLPDWGSSVICEVSAKAGDSSPAGEATMRGIQPELWVPFGHECRIFAKLDVRDRVQAVIVAYECGLVRPGNVVRGPGS